MAEVRWQRVWELFHELLEQPAAARAAWIVTHCDGDTDLAAELAGLLAAHHANDNPLDRGPALAVQAPELAPGTPVGRYRVLRALGHGGMGRVYLVERGDGEYAQQAALKLLDPLLAQPRLIEGFLRERQILARLQHPRIARLLDGGHTAEGLPYLVMEYIDGVPIDKWCAANAPSLADTLRLFATVCETVDFAHRHLVVHRDIKPGNVLVTAAGEPVLLDFGIAKNLAAHDTATLAGELRPLTPRYAAPEQLEGGVVGTAADVYALGVLLYELISQGPAYDTAGLTFAELARRLHGEEPPPVRVAARRRGVRTRLPVELDWICRRAMQAKPAARYRSAHALADDVRALLSHRPVAAQREGLWYAARKFVRRRWPVALAALLFVAMAAAFVWRLEAETRRTRVALAETRVARDRAESVAAFLAALFREADTTQAGGRVVPAREVLDRGRAQLAARDDVPPATRAMLLNSLAGVYRNMGASSTAAELLVEARGLLPAAASPALEAETLANLGAVWELDGRHREARDVLQRALALRREQSPPDRVALIETAERLAVTLQSLGERDAAGPLFTEAYALAGESLPPTDGRRADAALRLGSWYWVAGRLDDAARYYGEALAVRREQSPPDLPELARTLDGAGTLAHAQGRYADAVAALDEAIALRRRVLGDDHRHTADSLSNLGACRFDMGDDAAAEPALREALAIYDRVLPADSPVLAKTLNNLGLVRQRQRDRAEARALFERALAINRAAYGDDHARVAGNRNNLGLLAEDEDRLDDAAAAYRETLRILAVALGEKHAQLAYALTNLGRVRLWQGDAGEALSLFARARAIRAEALPAEHPAQAETLTWYGYAQCTAGDRTAGVAMLRDALALRSRSLGEDDATTAQSRALLGLCEVVGGDATQGRAEMQRARPLLVSSLGEEARLVRLIDAQR